MVCFSLFYLCVPHSANPAWVPAAGRGTRQPHIPAEPGLWKHGRDSPSLSFPWVTSVLACGERRPLFERLCQLEAVVHLQEPMLPLCPTRPAPAGEGPTRLYSVMAVGPCGCFCKEYLLAWCMQVLSMSMQTYHSQVLAIRISR